MNDDELPRPEDLVDREPAASNPRIDGFVLLVLAAGLVGVGVIFILAALLGS